MARSSFLPLALSMALVAVARDAAAFCRMTTTVSCDEPSLRPGEPCFKPTAWEPCDDGGRPIWWPTGCISYSVQKDASSKMGLDLAAAEQLVQEAFDTWSEVDCSASSSTCAGAKTGRPSIRASNAGPVTCGCVEFNGKSGNSNTIVFRDEAWLTCDGETIADREQSQLALTTVTYIPATGEIVDADIEINTAQNLITAGNGRVRNDLASILAHETGHFLGLAHTQPENADATMYTSYVVGKTQMRDLSRDDVCGICSTYPPGRTSACDGTPHRGLSDQCHGGDLADDVVSCGCRVVGSQAPRPGHLAMAGLAALGAAWRARSRRKSERGCG